jgi:hypothetical protein
LYAQEPFGVDLAETVYALDLRGTLGRCGIAAKWP